MIDIDNRINHLSNNIIFKMNSRSREYFQVLKSDSRRLSIEFDNLRSRVDMMNDLRNAEQMSIMITLLTRDQMMWWFQHQPTQRNAWFLIVFFIYHHDFTIFFSIVFVQPGFRERQQFNYFFFFFLFNLVNSLTIYYLNDRSLVLLNTSCLKTCILLRHDYKATLFLYTWTDIC